MTPRRRSPKRRPGRANTDALRASLVSAFRCSLHDLAPARLVREFLQTGDTPSPSALIAVGKAAPAMAEGALDVLGCTRGLVVTTDGTPCPALPRGFELAHASHPIPDARSIHAATLALHMATSVRQHLLVLISGGTSSLLCAPANGLTLLDKQAITQTLLRSGATIRQVNTVRRHLSRIKGGQLALASECDVTCLLISDVIGGAPHDVGSGPACADPTTVDDACHVLDRVLQSSDAKQVRDKLVETLSPHDAAAQRLRVVSLAGPEDLAARMRIRLEQASFRVTSASIAEVTADALARRLISDANALAPASAVVLAAEPTIALPPSAGSGGRAGWIALRVCAHLPNNTALLAAASDGVDGSSGGGGACVGYEHALDARGATATDALARFDDANIHQRWDTRIDGSATGVNMTDLYVVARA